MTFYLHPHPYSRTVRRWPWSIGWLHRLQGVCGWPAAHSLGWLRRSRDGWQQHLDCLWVYCSDVRPGHLSVRRSYWQLWWHTYLSRQLGDAYQQSDTLSIFASHFWNKYRTSICKAWCPVFICEEVIDSAERLNIASKANGFSSGPNFALGRN